MDCISGFSKYIDIVSKLFSTREFLKTNLTKLISNNAIEQHYSLDCMPTKLVVPSTDKANRCLYQQLDPSNYESGARMV
jgi:hypothetical protein